MTFATVLTTFISWLTPVWTVVTDVSNPLGVSVIITLGVFLFSAVLGLVKN